MLRQEHNRRLPYPAMALTGCCLMPVHAQIDHTTGLLMLREHAYPLKLFCTAPVKEDLSTGNPLFKVLEHYCSIDWNEIHVDADALTIDGASDVQFKALPLTSNAPPYSPHRDKPVVGDTIGMFMTDSGSGKSLFYAPGLGEMEEHVWQAMQRADVVLVDGIDGPLAAKRCRWHDRVAGQTTWHHSKGTYPH